MKLTLAAIVIFAFTTDLSKGHEQGLRKVQEDDDCVLQLGSLFNPGLFMVATGTGSNSRVKLVDFQDCSTFCIEGTTSGTTEVNGLIRVKDTNMCLQASHGNTLKDGSKMRLYPCDKDNIFQQFAWIDNGRMVLKSDQYSDLCATNRGVKAVEGDPVIFKTCDSINPVKRQQWFGD